jgi:hypothetical protein
LQRSGHGKIETRKCSVINDFKRIENQYNYKGLQMIIKTENARDFKNSTKPTENAIWY